jgi:hypothetical protein
MLTGKASDMTALKNSLVRGCAMLGEFPSARVLNSRSSIVATNTIVDSVSVDLRQSSMTWK